VIWLAGGLRPDFKTIADLRGDNGLPIQATCRQFVLLRRQIGLLTSGAVAIDGSKFKTVNSRDNNYSPGVVQRRIEQVEASIARNLTALDTADRQDPDMLSGKAERLQERLVHFRKRVQHLHCMKAAVDAAPDRQISLTDPDARAMATTSKSSGLVS
jgi:hypothetical protein